MGVKVYYYVVAAVLGFGFLIPQHGNKKKIYIALMAILQIGRASCRERV